jgi:hypothetical protein
MVGGRAVKDELKAVGVVAALGAAVGGGLALGMGLRFFSAIAMIGLGTGLALGVAISAAPKAGQVGAAPLSQLS